MITTDMGLRNPADAQRSEFVRRLSESAGAAPAVGAARHLLRPLMAAAIYRSLGPVRGFAMKRGVEAILFDLGGYLDRGDAIDDPQRSV